MLKFTFEVEAKKKLPFSDSTIMKTSHRLLTVIHIKETNTDECLNYNSFVRHRYKTGVIKTMLNRAYKVCSNWDMMHKEIIMLKQMFTNNNYPMSLLDREVNKFLSSKLQPGNTSSAADRAPEPTKLFYKSQMNSNYK